MADICFILQALWNIMNLMNVGPLETLCILAGKHVVHDIT